MFLYIAINKDRNTGYDITVPSLLGCFSYGDTLEQAIEETKQAIVFHIDCFSVNPLMAELLVSTMAISNKKSPRTRVSLSLFAVNTHTPTKKRISY